MGKYLHKNKTKMNIPVRAAAVLLCLALVSTYFVSDLFARYTTSDQSSDSARVAKFSIESSEILSQFIGVSLAPGGTDERTFTVENNSEVDVEYTVTVDNVTKNLPLKLSLETVAPSSSTVQIDGTTATAHQNPGSHEDTYKLRITWPKDTAKYEESDAARDIALMGMVDHIAVVVKAVQID